MITPFVPMGAEQKSPVELIISLAIILSGVPIYYLFVARENKPKPIYQLWSKFFELTLPCMT